MINEQFHGHKLPVFNPNKTLDVIKWTQHGLNDLIKPVIVSLRKPNGIYKSLSEIFNFSNIKKYGVMLYIDTLNYM